MYLLTESRYTTFVYLDPDTIAVLASVRVEDKVVFKQSRYLNLLCFA